MDCRYYGVKPGKPFRMLRILLMSSSPLEHLPNAHCRGSQQQSCQTTIIRHYRTFDLLFESGLPTGGEGLLIGISSRYPKVDELPPKIVGIMAKQESVGCSSKKPNQSLSIPWPQY